jgi:hypothetical protein
MSMRYAVCSMQYAVCTVRDVKCARCVRVSDGNGVSNEGVGAGRAYVSGVSGVGCTVRMRLTCTVPQRKSCVSGVSGVSGTVLLYHFCYYHVPVSWRWFRPGPASRYACPLRTRSR